jgi:hypothetical protein
MEFKLFCVILEGDHITSPFAVSIERDDTVDDLKGNIKQLQHLDAYVNTNLELWRLEPPIPNDDETGVHVDSSVLNANGIKMHEISEIKNVFPERPPMRHLHIYMKKLRGKCISAWP